MWNQVVTLQTLYDLFFGKDLVILSKNEPKSPPISRCSITPVTPISKMLLELVSPESKGKYLKGLRSDDIYIEQLEKKNERLDPDYEEKMENNGLGFYMENFVSWYGLCPICKRFTLRKYICSNVPVVDYVCINYEYHLSTNTCFLFQLKISLTEGYFSFQKQTISIGSRRYGEIPHTVKGTNNMITKRIMPGYICIKLNRTQESQIYTIDDQNSFILIPNYYNSSDIFYYEYLSETDKYGKDIITWNPSMFTISGIKTILNTPRVNYEVFEEIPIKNPYIDLI
jgi:hypothetical protein